jgi:hypothetical protein
MQAAIGLRDALAERVHTRTGRRVSGLTVEVAGGAVVLRGVARSYHVKQLAQHGAREVLPDAKLLNAIVVQPAA